MNTCFYLICPTDCLEQTINKQFKGENYFYSSLGNSFNYDNQTLKAIKTIIKKNNIRHIYFVLSLDNKIILDAVGKQKFSNINALSSCYKHLKKQGLNAQLVFDDTVFLYSVISYYLNQKIKELQIQFSFLSQTSIEVRGKIYNKSNNAFSNIYTDLVCLQKHQLN